ncbi:ankyrin-3 [Apiospora arundinis]
MSQMSTAWTTTNQGLRLSLLLQPRRSSGGHSEDDYVAVLECSMRRDDDTHRSPGVHVRRLYGDQFARIWSNLVEDVPTPSFEQSLDDGTYQTCFFKQNPVLPVPDFMISFGNLAHDGNWNPQTRVVEVHPPKSWDSETGTVWSGFDKRQHLTGMIRFHSKIVGDVDFAFGLERRSRGGMRPWALNKPALASQPLAQAFDTLQQYIEEHSLENVPLLLDWRSSMDHVPVRIKVHEQKVHGRLSYMIKAWEPTELSGEMVKMASWDDILSVERSHEWSNSDEPDKVEIPRLQLQHLLEDLTVPDSLDYWFSNDPLSLPKAIRVPHEASTSQLLNRLLLQSPLVGRTEDETRFLCCCANGNIKMINDFLKYESSTLKDSVSSYPIELGAIHWAAARGHINIMELLLSNGFDVNTSTSQGWTPMHIAGLFGQYQALLWLLGYKNGIDELEFANLGLDNRANQMLETPLHLAMSQASTVSDVVELDALVELSEKVLNLDVLDLQNHFDETPMHRLAAGGLSSLAKARGLDQVLGYETRNSFASYPGKYVDHRGRTLLWHAVCSGHAEGVHYFLNTQIPTAVNQSDNDGLAPLHVACRLGFVEIARALLKAGAWPNAVTSSDPGFSAAHYAALFNRAECLELLVRHGADIHQATQSPEFVCRPIHLANANNHTEVRRVLVAAGGAGGRCGLHSFHRTSRCSARRRGA